MVYKPAAGTIRYSTRRHWFEIVAEISDFVFWSAIVVLLSVGFAGLTYPRVAWLMLLCFYPLGHLAAELIKWNSEWFYLVDCENGSTKIVKVSGFLTRRTIVDDTKTMGRTTTDTLFDRFIGYKRVHLVFATRTYLDGERVPVRLLEEIDKAVTKKSDAPPEGERALIATMIPEWLREGILDKSLAKIAVQRLIGENL